MSRWLSCFDPSTKPNASLRYEQVGGERRATSLKRPLAPENQRAGLACEMMDEAERRLRASGCPKINLQVRNGNASAIEFYRAIGYAQDDVISMGKRLEHDERDA